jgi:Dolichyl-phosphate-mannose-protein mannosyltransferase
MATDVRTAGQPTRLALIERVRLPAWTGAAWGAIALWALFLGITFWWLSQDRSIPIYDSGLHLLIALDVHEYLQHGELAAAFSPADPYPPLAYTVGALGVFVGGVGVAPPIIAENLVFVSLLVLGCYKVGRLAFGPTGGLLAVIFALGSPLLIAQSHVFMIDVPETAMVAVSVWLIIATEGFSRIGASALAGLAVGLGMMTKEPFAFFVAGILVVTALRGGWRAWRGIVVFAVVALVVALPWYLENYAVVHATGSTAVAAANHPQYPSDIAPPRFSYDNLAWYLWNFINFQTFFPLFLFAATGWVWMIVGFLRRRPVSPLAPELAVGAFVAWFAITETFVHDNRYSEPILLYLAVIGTGWLTQLPRPGRLAAVGVLVVVALANTLGTSFGVGKQILLGLPGGTTSSLQYRGELMIYSNSGFQVSGPKRDGDLIAMLRALRRDGVRDVTWFPRQALEPDFTNIGVSVLSHIAGLTPLERTLVFSTLTRRDAVFAHEPIRPNEPPPCVRLYDNTGVWVRLGNPTAPGTQDFCPFPSPHFYGPKEA